MNTIWHVLCVLAVLTLGTSPCWAEVRATDIERTNNAKTMLRGSDIERTNAAKTMLYESDERRAIPNNTSPPARLVPLHRLAPLPPEAEGTIRRVAVNGPKVVALTFDLCELATSTSGYDAPLIDFLRAKQIPATVFLGGKWMRTHSERTLELLADPLFEIGTHGWAHGNFGIMTESAMQRELDWSNAQYELLHEELLRRLGAVAPVSSTDKVAPVSSNDTVAPVGNNGTVAHLRQSPALFRLPYGRCSDAALRLLAQSGLRVIQWDRVGEIAKDNTQPGLEKNVVAGIQSGSIVLFHANLVPKGSADILRRTVALLQAQGYSFVTVGQLLAMGKPCTTRDGYFKKPGDNHRLDTLFGVDGTGAKR